MIEILDSIRFHDEYYIEDKYNNGLYKLNEHQRWNECSCFIGKKLMEELKQIESSGIEKIELPILDEIYEKMKSHIPVFDDKEKLEKWYIGLYKDSGFRLLNLVVESPDGTKDLSGIVEHNNFLDILIKIFTVRKRAGEYLVIDFLKNASQIEKAKIQEEDKKYKPQYKDREKAEKEKLTASEKTIRKLTAAGMSREDAEKLILGIACTKCGLRICKCEK